MRRTGQIFYFCNFRKCLFFERLLLFICVIVSFNMLLYQLPPTQNFTFELYAQLTKEDYIIIDFASNTFNIHIRTTTSRAITLPTE